jgi:predicted RNA binding protein YcfA (HicA-like mRNA interferase family)
MAGGSFAQASRTPALKLVIPAQAGDLHAQDKKFLEFSGRRVCSKPEHIALTQVEKVLISDRGYPADRDRDSKG